ncbi:hypothetical protein QYF61_017320 [Mycteria americana]|uniref:Uncharacterized protein n=1 Tax=Mycteria americana TaxID=33587 RepID=A0AAN7NL51_MYCAM|nr:hypothetical protein QYF61_017320 [Mycteria americana]
MSQQCALAAETANSTLGTIHRGTARTLKGGIISLCSALMRSRLTNWTLCPSFRLPSTGKNLGYKTYICIYCMDNGPECTFNKFMEDMKSHIVRGRRARGGGEREGEQDVRDMDSASEDARFWVLLDLAMYGQRSHRVDLRKGACNCPRNPP